MAIIRDRELQADWNNPSAEMINHCITEHRLGNDRLNKLERYYLGLHDILARKVTKGLPNNKVVSNHAKFITDIAVGYFIGNPVKYEGSGIDVIVEAFKRADAATHDAELAKDLSIFGEARELNYMSSDPSPIPKLSVLDPRQSFLVVDDTVEYRPLFGVHYYEKKNMAGEKIGYSVNVYTEKNVHTYFAVELDANKFEFKSTKQHFFNGVPIVEYYNNEEQQGDFEQVLSLIDAYNVLMSDRINDKEQFADAILKLKGASLGDTVDESSATIKLLKEMKVLDLPLDGEADWLTKAMKEADVEVLRDAIRQDIHTFTMVPNLTDENFVGNASGVAMKYKLIGLEQMAVIKERYFKAGLRQRLKLVANVLHVKGAFADVSDVTITMVRNLPVNEVEIANMIAQLKDMVPTETLIALLPFIQDAAAEIKKLDEEKNANMEREQKAFGMPAGADGEEVTDDEETDK